MQTTIARVLDLEIWSSLEGIPHLAPHAPPQLLDERFVCLGELLDLLGGDPSLSRTVYSFTSSCSDTVPLKWFSST